MQFILINERTRHTCRITRDEIVQLVDVRSNPGGYTDVARCMAMIDAPPPEHGHIGFPLQVRGRFGMEPVTINIEGRMDLPNNLVWKEPGHRCGRCV